MCLACVGVLLIGCAPEEPMPVDPVEGAVRLSPTFLEFDDWTDYLPIQVGLAADCRFLEPQIDDDTTAWAPLQVFWVIYDNENDVTHGQVVHDTFFAGDEVRVSDFPRRAGMDPLGFNFIGPLQRTLLPLESSRRMPGGYRIEASLGGPVKIDMAMESYEGEEGCDVVTTYCEQPCDLHPDDWPPFRSAEFILGALYSVQDIVIDEG